MAAAALLLLALSTLLAARLLLSALARLAAFRRLEAALPGPPALPVVGNLALVAGLTEQTALRTFLALAARYPPGQMFRLSFFGRLFAVISDPDDIAQLLRGKELMDKDPLVIKLFEPINRGLVTLNGPAWRAHRRLILPAFHRSMLASFMPVFCAEARGFVGRVRAGEQEAVAEGLQRMAVRAFYRNSAAGAAGGDADEAERALPIIKSFLDSFTSAFIYRMNRPWLWPDLAFRLTACARRRRRLQARFDRFSLEAIASRRAQLARQRDGETSPADPASAANHSASADGKGRDGGPPRGLSLLDILLLESGEDGGADPLTDDEVLDEFQIFYVAAIDTTVSAVSWALKTLSLRLDVQERIRHEVEAVLGPGEAADFSAEDLDKLEYTERVVKETLRLFPPAPILLRAVDRPAALGGHALPAGSSVVVNVSAAHRDPRHWPEPRRFDPDRFLAERSQGRHTCAFLPFSAGPRNCIGGKYAMMSIKTLLATLVPRYRIDAVDDGHAEPADFPMMAHITSKMVGGTRVVFTPWPGRTG